MPVEASVADSFWRDEARLAHPRHHHLAGAVAHQGQGAQEGVPQPLGQPEDGVGLGLEHASGVGQRGLALVEGGRGGGGGLTGEGTETGLPGGASGGSGHGWGPCTPLPAGPASLTHRGASTTRCSPGGRSGARSSHPRVFIQGFPEPGEGTR